MSDVRARLVDALLDKYFYGTSPDAAGRIADVLLSLPGIAIVELPEPVPLTWPNAWTPHELSVPALRAYAAALLAAANAAESVTP